VVTTVAGHSIGCNTDLREAIGLLRVGDAVTIDLLHDGRREQRHAVLANALPAAAASSRASSAGRLRN
jgi:S1-C subfamily serine protease